MSSDTNCLPGDPEFYMLVARKWEAVGEDMSDRRSRRLDDKTPDFLGGGIAGTARKSGSYPPVIQLFPPSLSLG